MSAQLLIRSNNNYVLSLQGSTRQQGVLRTNCIDCVDRTNVAQYAFGALALGRQLQALGFCAASRDLDPRSSLSRQLMAIFESMGHSLARQYGGSEAHATFFQRERGNWEAATQSRDLMTTLRRFYSNTYTDAEKQDAMNLFLGHFIPRPGHANIWDLDSDYYLHSGWPVTGQAMGMGASHPQQLQSIPESPSHSQATTDGFPGNPPSGQPEKQSDGLSVPSTSQVSHAAAHGLDQAGRTPFEPLRASSSNEGLDAQKDTNGTQQLLPMDSEPTDSGQRLVMSESMIKRLLPEQGRGFDHMASSSGSEIEEAAEDSEPEEEEGGNNKVPPQPRIGGSMRLRDRFPRPQAGLAQPSLPKPASASSLPDIARTGNDLAPRQTPIPQHNSQSALSTALHHQVGPAIPKDQQRPPIGSRASSQSQEGSNVVGLSKSASADAAAASADAAGSVLEEAQQGADGAAPAPGQQGDVVGAKRGPGSRRAGLAVTPPSAIEVLGLPTLSNPAKRLKLESFDTMIGKAPNAVHHVCLSPPMEPVQRAALPQWLSTPLTLPRLRSMEPSADGSQGMLSYWPSFGPLSQGSPLDRTRSSSLSGSQPSRHPSMLLSSPFQDFNSTVISTAKLPASASPSSTPGKLPLGRMTRLQTIEPGEVGQRLVQSARGPNKRRPSLSRRPKLKEEPPLLLVLDAGEASVRENASRGALRPQQPAIRRAVSMDLHVDFRQMQSLQGPVADQKGLQVLQRTSSTEVGKSDRRASMEHQLPRRYVTFPSVLTQSGHKPVDRQLRSAPTAHAAAPRRPASDTNISGLRPQPVVTLAQAQREGQGPQAVLEDIARRPNLTRSERTELQSLGLTATAQTCWGTASGSSEDLAWLSNPAVKAAYTRNHEKAVGMASASAHPHNHSSYKRLIKPQGAICSRS
ncbi:hypothetical protein WJX84_009767 [Apatococcus fuscideae]|uniref:SAC domain-containing protein n=1 Tax=Apatococcus fuscideae TaxID=2026836 RepID=A0AAW1SK77_9CHLO